MQRRQSSIHLCGTGLMLGLIAAAGAPQANAYSLYSDANNQLDATGVAVYGIFHSQKNYDGQPGGSSWREGFIKYGLTGTHTLDNMGTAYGAFSLVSSATWGQGDPGGFTDGSERTTKIEDAYMGWRSGDLFPTLGKDGVDISGGRQVIKLGSGFLINDDGTNTGKAPAEGDLNRGGAYYIAARHAFDRTAVLRLGGQDGLHGSAQWLKSDNPIQANTELAAGTLDYTMSAGTLGLTWIHGLDVSDRFATEAQRQRRGMNVYSLRGEGNAGIPNANFAFEYASQTKDSGTDTAWYGEAGYTFADVAWTPSLTYRYTRYSTTWDPLFTGLSTGYGTWFQGEVAANYAGPFSSNTGVNHMALKAKPLDNLTLGALFFDFKTLHKQNTLNLDAQELDLYAEWAVNAHLIVTPLIGLYKPSKDDQSGGNQVGSNRTNLYSQLVVAIPF